MLKQKLGLGGGRGVWGGTELMTLLGSSSLLFCYFRPQKQIPNVTREKKIQRKTWREIHSLNSGGLVRVLILNMAREGKGKMYCACLVFLLNRIAA